MKSLEDFYKDRGIGSTSVGFGDKLSVLVIDMQYAFFDPASPLRLDPEMSKKTISSIRLLLNEARGSDIPIVYTYGGFRRDLKDAGRWKDKWPNLREGWMEEGTRYAQILDELNPQAGDYVVKKPKPSAFFGTDVDSYLRSMEVDTTIITGCVTSGCVRASVVDAFSHDYRVIVPEECVVDRADDPHRINLFDVNMKYSDVIKLEEVLREIRKRKVITATQRV